MDVCDIGKSFDAPANLANVYVGAGLSGGLGKECSRLCKERVETGNYEKLENVFGEAIDQASKGKGNDRHAQGENFENQLICWIERRGFGFQLGRAVELLDESLRMDKEAAIKELLGAINYIAAKVIILREMDDGQEAARARAAALLTNSLCGKHKKQELQHQLAQVELYKPHKQEGKQ